MPINMPNFGNIAGAADKPNNIFEHRTVRRLAARVMRKANASAAARNAPGTPTQFPRTMSPAPPGTGPLPPNAAAAGRQRRQQRAMGIQQPRSTSQASGKAPSFAPQRTATAGGGQASGRAPSFGPATPSNQPFSNAQRGVPTHVAPPVAANPFSHAGSHTPQVNSAPKPSTNPFQAPTATPASTPTAHGTSSVQFSAAPGRSIPHAAVNTGSNRPFPTHQHPSGSSAQILPHLSSTESAKGGAPNTFTVGSRNIKGGGIAAMGSKLEAGLNSRPLSTPHRTVQPKQFGGTQGSTDIGFSG